MRTRLQKPGRIKEATGARGKTWLSALYVTICIIILASTCKLLFQPRHFITPLAHADFTILNTETLFPKDTTVPQPKAAADIDRWERVKHAIRNIAPFYGLSPKLGIAQAALESGRGTSQYCIERNNCFGIAAYDWNPDEAYYFNSIEEGVIEYYRLQREVFPEAWANKNDPQKMLELLENNDSGLQYATDPMYVLKIINLPEWNEN